MTRRLLALSATAPAATDVTTPSGDRTGIAELDAVIDALLAGDPEALRPLIGFTMIPCSSEAGLGGPPLCGQDEPDGTLVEVFPRTVCETEYRRQLEIDIILESFVGANLYAVYPAPPDTPFSEYIESEYVAVVFSDAGDVDRASSEVVVSDGRIVAYLFSCALPPEELVEQRQLENPLLPPQTP